MSATIVNDCRNKEKMKEYYEKNENSKKILWKKKKEEKQEYEWNLCRDLSEGTKMGNKVLTTSLQKSFWW